MKTIGLIGGMSWESTVTYYRLINEGVKDRLGGWHSAKTLLHSVDFAEIHALQHAGRWDEAANLLIDAAKRLQNGGADFIVICTNTMHKVADQVTAALRIPLIHIADPTGEAIKAKGLTTVGLLGTRFTMEQEFYRGRLTDRCGLNVITPGETDRQTVHDIIYNELCLGKIDLSSRATYREIMRRLVQQGAQAIILGCTEIGLLVDQRDASVPLFDTTRLHAEQAVALALEE